MAVNDAGVAAPAFFLRDTAAVLQQIRIRNGRIGNIDIGLGGTIITDGAAGEDQIAKLNSFLKGAA